MHDEPPKKFLRIRTFRVRWHRHDLKKPWKPKPQTPNPNPPKPQKPPQEPPQRQNTTTRQYAAYPAARAEESQLPDSLYSLYRVCMHVYISICTYVYIYVPVYIYINIWKICTGTCLIIYYVDVCVYVCVYSICK